MDYFLVSTFDRHVTDFVGIEFQSLDTTGSVWPERQRFLHSVGIPVAESDFSSPATYGMNWKMTAKTTLIQLHHKVQTFESLNKHLVLVAQNELLTYLRRAFSFGHVAVASDQDSMQIHAYELIRSTGGDGYKLRLSERASTNAAGVETSLGLRADPLIDLMSIVATIERRISDDTLLTL